MSGVFLCHSSKDKAFVRRLSYALEAHDIRTWLDESELLVGDSLVEKIGQAIHEMEYLVIVLSPDSVASKWANQELEVAMSQQLRDGRVKALPILYRDCVIPPLLEGKLYADFRDPNSFDESLSKLLRRFEAKPIRRPSLTIPISTGRILPEVNAIAVHDLSVWFKNRQILQNLCFSVRQGEIFGIIGPSGAGKSTLAHTLVGHHEFMGRIEFPQSHIVYNNLTRCKVQVFDRRVVQLVTPPVSQEHRKLYGKRIYDLLKDEMDHSVDLNELHDQIEFVLHVSGIWDEIKDKLQARLHYLSGIEQLKVLLARALMTDPKILMLDHVMDIFQYFQPAKLRFLQVLFDLNAKGMTIIVTGGVSFSLLAPWCDRIALLTTGGKGVGEILDIDTPAALVKSKRDYPLLALDEFIVQV